MIENSDIIIMWFPSFPRVRMILISTYLPYDLYIIIIIIICFYMQHNNRWQGLHLEPHVVDTHNSRISRRNRVPLANNVG